MVERTNEKPDGRVKAANFLRDGLRTHKVTGDIIAELSKDPEGFGSDFAQAATPCDVLAAFSRFGSSEQRAQVASLVETWVKVGNDRGISPIGEIIRRDYHRWIKMLELTPD